MLKSRILSDRYEQLETVDVASSSGEDSASVAPVARPVDTPAKYRPYLVDWRFLPEHVLLAKDTVRHGIVGLGAAMAAARLTRPVWRRAFRNAMVPPVLAAGRLFIHIPKTGGTSICANLYGRNLPHATASFWREMYGAEIAAVPSFAVLREPLDRLQSAYRFIKYGGTDVIAVSRYDMFRLRGTDTFDQFVERLHLNPKLLTTITTLQSQADFVCDADGNPMVDRLFRMEKGRMPDDLNRWLGIEVLPELNRSSVEPIQMSNVTVGRVEQLYASDFALFHG
ncbi:hypothetical protein CA233_15110 [Sphingomonas sp. ABOLD]|uniref:Sulfotransferase family protein n=1 Tax=Sphingomonas trueperi TaxID=53317 RepID=A0A7X5XZL2_9SPHN|nr:MULTISPECIES: hypothetical protein [Sphingomonas]NJB98294.1 hypothetical protein [Sphingomonas trueperi]RSV44784.1 hypothetical protein CA233_15110 [Sphingomonas sp. ABOLD]RSV45468.1 hypothetical protein CA234_01050 [Sphingomonas sp. ABOLE]